jgi:uncharacterized membrane protein
MTFTVNEFQDLLYILETNPAWRQKLLEVLFPETFLELPQAVAALAEGQRQLQATLEQVTLRMEKRFAEVAANRERIWQALQVTNERMDKGFAEAAADREQIRQALRETNQRMDKGFAEAAADREQIRQALRETNQRMDKGFTEAKNDRNDLRKMMRDVKGDNQEMFYRNRAAGIFGRWLRKGHDATNEVADHLYTAHKAGEISDLEYTQVLAADLLWGGALRETGAQVILVIEVSWWVELSDIERAESRAAILRRLGLKAIPVTAGKEWPEELLNAARQRQLAVAINGLLDDDSWEQAWLATAPNGV